jgi:pyridoxal phosphate enzyme (YggS family)
VSELQENLTRIRSRIDQACERSGRQPDSVRLMAVSKNQPPERVAEAASAGLTLFGENRIQDAKVKIPLCPGQLEWHFIGHLQSNKSRDAVSLFQVVQGVDSLALAEELQKQALKQARSLPILLEVNVAGESSKFGWNPDRLLAELLQLNALNRLEVHGLMTIAPYAVDPEQVRPIFRRLRELRDRCTDLLGAPLPVLSMGMSGDLEVAIEEGATLVRVGTALFGERPRRTEADNPPGASNSVG